MNMMNEVMLIENLVDVQLKSIYRKKNTFTIIKNKLFFMFVENIKNLSDVKILILPELPPICN